MKFMAIQKSDMARPLSAISLVQVKAQVNLQDKLMPKRSGRFEQLEKSEMDEEQTIGTPHDKAEDYPS